MSFRSTFANYLGQFRLYSFVDLLLLLTAARASAEQFVGISLLWFGFIAFLESKHAHSYRKPLPKYLWLILYVPGLLLFRKIEAVLFILLSYFYTKKIEGNWGMLAPIFRGLQMFFLIGGIIDYAAPLAWLAFVLITIRNLLGDFRDVEKDRKEKAKTIPVVLGLKRDVKHAHIAMVMITSAVWWSFTSLNVVFLIAVLTVQLATYKLTPR